MSEDTNRNARIGAIIAIVVFVLIASAGAWYWLMYLPEQEAIEKARLEQIAREKAEQERKELEAQNKIKYDSLIASADAEFEQQNWETAQSLYSEASALFPDEAYASDQLALVTAELDKIAARKEAGIVETVASPTGRFYVIVSSSVDGDLAMDYANKLATEGADVKLITPQANRKVYHRVAIGDYSSREQAESASSSLVEYGDGVWVLKY